MSKYSVLSSRTMPMREIALKTFLTDINTPDVKQGNLITPLSYSRDFFEDMTFTKEELEVYLENPSEVLKDECCSACAEVGIIYPLLPGFARHSASNGHMKASAQRATHKRPDPKDPSKKINVVPLAIPIRDAVAKYYAQPGRLPTDTMTFAKQDLPVVNLQADQSASLSQQPPTQQNRPTFSSANDSMFLRAGSHVEEDIMSGDSRRIMGSPARAALAGSKRSHSQGGSENDGGVQSARKSPILDLEQGPALGSAGVFEQDLRDSSDRSHAINPVMSPARAPPLSLADVGRVPAVGSAETFAQFWFEPSPGKSQLAGDVVSNLLWAFHSLIKEGSWFSAPLLRQIIKSIGTLTLATESYKGELSSVYQQKTTDVEALSQSKLVALLLCHVHGAIMQPLVTLSHLSPPLRSLHSSYTHGPQIGNICTDLKRSIQGFYKAVGDAYSHVSRTIDTAVDDGNDHVDHASWLSSFPYKDVNKRRVDAIAQLENATGPVRELQTLLNALKEAEMEVTSRINCLETSIITPAQTVVDDTRVEKEIFKKQAYDVLKSVQGAFGMLFESLDDKSELKTSVLTSAPNVKKDSSLPSSDLLGSIAPTLLATDPAEYMHDGVSTVMQRLHDTGCIYKEGQEPFQFDKQRENELQPGIHKVKIGDLEGFMWLKRSKEQSNDVAVPGEEIVEVVEEPLETPMDYARLLQDWGQKGTASTAADNVDVANDFEQAAPKSAGLSAGGGSAGSCGNDSECFVFPAIPVDIADATVSGTFKVFETVENLARGDHILVVDARMHPDFEEKLKENPEHVAAAAATGWKLYATIQLNEGKIGIENDKSGRITLVPFLTPRLDDVYVQPGYTPWKPRGMHVTLTLLGLAQAKLYKAAPWIYFRNAEPELAAWYSVINTSPSHPITHGLKKGVIEIDVTVLYGPIKGLERERGSTYLVILHNYAMGESPFEIAIVELCTENFTQGPLLEPADGSPIRKVPLKMANESVGKWVDTKKGGLIDGFAEDLDFYPAYVYSPKNAYMMTDLEIETLMAKYKALELEEFTAVKHPSLETSGTSSGTSRNEEDGGDQQGNTKSALGNIEGGGKARDDILGPSSNPVLQKGSKS